MSNSMSGPMARAALYCAALAILAGCAAAPGGNPPPGPGPGQEPITASDEGNARARARIRLELAIGYFEAGQTTVALDETKLVLAADPAYAEAYNLRGLIYMRLDDAALAEDSFRRALALNPREANTLHNYGWLLCQQKRYRDAAAQFALALAVPGYTDSAKTLMTQGVCEMRAGQSAEAEVTLKKAYEIDAGNPVVGYNLAQLMAQRGDWSRAQFYVRRINNGAHANAETLWLGVRVERRMQNREAALQLASQLQRRFPQSREALAYERGNFDD